MATPYVIDEVLKNLPELPPAATMDWVGLRSALSVMDDVFTLDRPVVFGPSKDWPILFDALAWGDVLLTLDRIDFGDLMNRPFCGLPILTPGMFLQHERAAGRLS